MFLNVIQLAESLGVEESVVDGWVRHEGLPCVQDRGRLLFDRAQVVAWAAERGLAAKAGFLAPVAPIKSPGRGLQALLRVGGIWRQVPPAKVGDVFEQVVTRLPGLSPVIQRMLVQRVRSPEGVTWAPVGGGLALPHLRSHIALGRDAGLVACIFLTRPLTINEPVPDQVPVTRLLFFIAPSPRTHLEILAKLSTALTRGNLRDLVLHGASDGDLGAAFAEAESPVSKARLEETA